MQEICTFPVSVPARKKIRGGVFIVQVLSVTQTVNAVPAFTRARYKEEDVRVCEEKQKKDKTLPFLKGKLTDCEETNMAFTRRGLSTLLIQVLMIYATSKSKLQRVIMLIMVFILFT